MGFNAGEEYLQIHVPKAESICSIAIQGTGYTYGNEYVIDYYVKHSEDGSLWKNIEEEPGKMKVFYLDICWYLIVAVEMIVMTIMMIIPYRKKVM